MSVFVGLDCGGSSSRVLALDEDGNVLFQGQSGAANLASTPEGRLRKNLSSAIKGCPMPDFVCGCFAGLIDQNARIRGLQILKDTFNTSATFRAEPDYTAALYAAPETDICVIAGTGSLVCSRFNGQIVKSGGKGYVLGDEGSGYYYGRDAVLQFLNHPERASEYLRKNVIDVFGSDEESTIITGVYKAPTPATILGRLAKCIGHDAANGEEYALKSLNRNMEQLILTVAQHIEHYHTDSETNPANSMSILKITLSGGVWKASHMFKEKFVELLRQRLPDHQMAIQKLSKPPLYGAVQLAKELRN